MERPFVVCHMFTSLDGKIDGAFFGAPEAALALQAYGNLRAFYQCQATLYGTTTMLGGFADGRVSALPEAAEVTREDFISPQGRRVGNFVISADPKGILRFDAPVMQKKGRPAAHVVEALTQQAPDSYFEQADFLPSHGPVPFVLQEAKPLEGNGLWLRHQRA